MNRFAVLSVLVAVSLAAAGCGSQPASSNSPPASVTVAEMNTQQQHQRQVALAARDDMFQQLLGRLTEVLQASDPPTAIDVCKVEAPMIAGRVGQEHGLTIGRTSYRLRNPKNAPPTWAEQALASRPEEPQFLMLPQEELGALLPIRLQEKCLKCHGPADMLAPGVAESLQRNFPDDQATGFQEGDLRGWFWVMVPPSAHMRNERSTSPAASTQDKVE